TFAKTSRTRRWRKPCVSAMTPMRSVNAQLLKDEHDVASIERAAFDHGGAWSALPEQLARLRDHRRKEKASAGRSPDEAAFDVVDRDRQLRDFVCKGQQLSEDRGLDFDLGPDESVGRNRHRLADAAVERARSQHAQRPR